MRIHFAALALAAIVGAIAEPTVDVYLVGDSTMADKPTPETNPERGWGQLLPNFFDGHVAIHNHAVNGRSTKSFIDEGKWGAVEHALKPGDYVFIQFGHNDEKVEDSARYAAPYTAYRKNLERFVAETRAKGATPVLFTPIVRRKFNAQGTIEDTHGAYPLVVREVARDLNVAFVDLQMQTEDLVRGAGPEGSKKLYVWVAPGESKMYPDGHQDDTHLSVLGATRVAGLAAAAHRAQRAPAPPVRPQRGRPAARRRGDSTVAARRTWSAGVVARRSAGDHAVHRAEGVGHGRRDADLSGRRVRAPRVGQGRNERRALAQHARRFGVRRALPAWSAIPPSDDAHRRSPRRASRSRPRRRLGHRSLTNRRHGLFRGRTHGVDRRHPMDTRRFDERGPGRTRFVAPGSGDSRVSGHHDDRAVRTPRLTPQPHRRAPGRSAGPCDVERAARHA